MTFTHIEYFIQVAKCLSFTEAAKQLFVTQPTLSRQITVIERELNMILFYRNSKSLKLTPCGELFYEEMTKLMKNYEQILFKAQQVNQGLSGTLRIGVLDGQDVSRILPDAMKYFEQQYPNIKIFLERLSFKKLVEQVYNNHLDAIITYDFDIEHKPGLTYIPIEQCEPIIAIPKCNKLANQEYVTIKDLEKEPLVIVNPNECEKGVNLIINECQKYGGFYPNLYFVDTMENAILWVEAGKKCAIFNTGMSIMNSNTVRFIALPEMTPMNLVLSWNSQNNNFALPLLINYF